MNLPFERIPGNDLLSRGVAPEVSSALKGLTTVLKFGDKNIRECVNFLMVLPNSLCGFGEPSEKTAESGQGGCPAF